MPSTAGSRPHGYAPAVTPETLDHVALWVADRDPIADFVTSRLGHARHRPDRRFTLVGSDARRGKLTLFEAEGPREPGALKHVALRVSSLESALGSLDGTQVDAAARGRGVLRRLGGPAARARRGADRRRVRPRPRRALVAVARGDGRGVPRAGLRFGRAGAVGRAAGRGRRGVRRVPPGRAGRSGAAAAEPSRGAGRVGRGAHRGGPRARDRDRQRRRRGEHVRGLRLGPGAGQDRVRRAQADLLA